MAIDWTMLRIRRRTHQRLKAMSASLQRQVVEGRLRLEMTERGELSADCVINHLLNTIEAHRERGRTQRAKKRFGRRQPTDGPSAE